MKSPRSFDELLQIWHLASLEVRSLVAELTPVQLALPTGCSAWSVQDIFAHVIDIESLMSGQSPLDHVPDWDSLPELGRSGRVTEIGVDGRRSRSLEALLVEFDEIIDVRLSQLMSGSHDLTALVKGPTGSDWTMQKSFEMRINDTWVHGQDIREALGIPGSMDSQAAAISAETLLEMLPFAWAKTVQAPIGSVLEIRVSAPFIISTQVVVDEDGRGGTTSGLVPTVLVEGDWGVLLPLLTGRTDDGAFTTQLKVVGDSELAGRLLAQMAITS